MFDAYQMHRKTQIVSHRHHTLSRPMARRTRLATGTSAMKYKLTEIEQENKKREIKKWQTIRSWNNGERH